MKKKYGSEGVTIKSFLSLKILKVMRNTLILFFLSTFHLFAGNSYSQSARVSLNLENVSVENVLDEIEKQSEFYFVLNYKLVDVERRVNIEAENEPISDILGSIFSDSDVEYLVLDRQIMLSPKNYLAEVKSKLQPITITGTVTDESGVSIPGVSILIKGTTKGTVTNLDGEYTIEVGDPSAVLHFSFVGFISQEIEISGLAVINITMVEGVIFLDEVIAVGYATQRIGEITGSVSSVNADQLADMPALDASETLKGMISGITAIESHTPGEGAIIRIRGLGTINNNDPLWIVDGVPGGANVIPNNIESISVLKDASAQAIYGSRGANGVILVTTKAGKKGQKPQINVTAKIGISKNINSYDLLNTREYGEWLWLMAKNQGIEDYSHALYGSGDEPNIPEYILPARAENVDHSMYDNQMIHEDGDDTFLITKANKEGTDWLDESDRTASIKQFGINITGGSQNTSYAFMGNFLDEEGILKHSGFKRTGLRSNVTSTITDWLEIGTNLGGYYSVDNGTQSDHSEGSVMSFTYRMQPIVPVYDVMGNFAGTRVPETGNARSPAFLLWEGQNNSNKNLTAIGNFYAKVTFFEGLSFKSLFGFNYISSKGRYFDYVEVATSERGTYDGLSESYRTGLQWSWTNTLTYSKTFGKHNINAILGTEAIASENRWMGASRNQFYSKDPLYMQLDVGERDISNNGNMSDWNLFSQFGRVNYNLANKYLVQATVRRDGSSRFGEEYRYAIFPAFSAGWRVSEESFMAFSEGWLTYLKIRAGWGQSGNDQIGNYNGFTTFSSNPRNSYYPISGSNISPTSGFQSSAIGEPSTHWETTSTTNLGIDATFFENLYLSVDLWKRETMDMLYPKKIPDILGQASAPSVNVGDMSNRGIDVEVRYFGSALNQDFQYNVSLNVSRFQNEIKNLSGIEDEFIEGGALRGYSYTRAETGHAYPEFYGYIVEGIFQTQEEADAHPSAFGEAGTYNEPGHFKYKDVDEDGVITSGDRTYIGSPHPDFTAGLNINLQYKEFRVSTLLYSSYGNEMVNQVRRYIDFHMFQGNRSKRALYESWGSPYLKNNENAVMPKVEFDDAGSQEPSTYFVEDASYLRMENLIISYNFAKLFPGLKFRKLEIYGQATNLFTLTNYSGLDPEVGAELSRGSMFTGVDAGAWPTPRQYFIGVSIGF